MATSPLPPGWENWCKTRDYGSEAGKKAVQKCLKDGLVRGHLSDLILNPDLPRDHSMSPTLEHLNDPKNHEDTVVEARIINHMKDHFSEEEFWKVIEHLFIVGVAKLKIRPPFGKRLPDGWSPQRHYARTAASTGPSEEMPAHPPEKPPAVEDKPRTFKATVRIIPKAEVRTVDRTAQTINFPPVPAKMIGDAPFALAAKSSAGLKITFAVVSGLAKISGNTVTLQGAGKVTIRASQAGNPIYAPATKTMSFVVKP